MTTEAKKRKFHTAEFKAKVGLQALAAEKTVNELAQQHKLTWPPKNGRHEVCYF